MYPCIINKTSMKKSEIIECNGVSYKNCPHCGRVLPVNCFSKSNTSASGYRKLSVETTITQEVESLAE